MSKILTGRSKKLVFEGIDTVADVYLNHFYLGRTDNMFLKYEFDVSTVLKEGEKRIKSNSLLSNQRSRKT